MKKLLYIEHIVLLLLIVHQAREFIHVHNFKSRLSKIKVANSSNAYYSEVSFWGANRFFKETRPVVNNGYQDVYITPGMLVYTSSLVSNRQCRVSLSLEEDQGNKGHYRVQVGTYDFEYGEPFSGLVGKSLPLEFTIGTNGINTSDNYAMSVSCLDGIPSSFPVCVTAASNQPEGMYMAYMYIGNPGTKFTPQDFSDFGMSPETFPPEKLNGRLFRIIWRYRE